MQKRADGSIVYRAGDQITDVTLNGVSVLALKVDEIIIDPDGWGTVLTEKQLDGSGEKTWVDGQKKRYILRGQIVVTP
jgi:hypothetical protein